MDLTTARIPVVVKTIAFTEDKIILVTLLTAVESETQFCG
jgi:hypothetical protein